MYSMIFLECNIRNLYISAPEHRSKMRIAPLDRARKTVFSMSFLIFCCNLKFFYNNSSKNLEIFNNYGKEKKRTLCFAVFCLTMSLNHRKSMTVWKLCEKSSKCDVAGHCSFIRLEMAKVWRKKSLTEKSAHFNFFQQAILVFPFLSMMQLRIVFSTWYPWAN